MSPSDASSETNEFNCKTSFTAQFYQRRYASRSPVSSDPLRVHVRCIAEVDRESRPSRPSVNRHGDAAHCCFESDGISQGQEQRVIHFVLSPGPRCRCHILHYLCRQVFHYISCHLFCNSRNLWRLQRPGWAWELMGTGATTGLYKHETGGGGSDGCDMPGCQLCHVWHIMTFPDTGEYWPGSTRCLWGHPSNGASFRCQRYTRALFGDCESISPRVIVIVKQ